MLRTFLNHKLVPGSGFNLSLRLLASECSLMTFHKDRNKISESKSGVGAIIRRRILPKANYFSMNYNFFAVKECQRL